MILISTLRNNPAAKVYVVRIPAHRRTVPGCQPVDVPAYEDAFKHPLRAQQFLDEHTRFGVKADLVEMTAREYAASQGWQI